MRNRNTTCVYCLLGLIFLSCRLLRTATAAINSVQPFYGAPYYDSDAYYKDGSSPTVEQQVQNDWLHYQKYWGESSPITAVNSLLRQRAQLKDTTCSQGGPRGVGPRAIRETPPSRCWNEQAVIFRSFRRSIFVSNVRSLMGSLSLSMSGQQLREDPWLPSVASPRVPPRDIGPHPRLSTLARLRRHTPPPCLMIKSIPWGKSDRAC